MKRLLPIALLLLVALPALPVAAQEEDEVDEGLGSLYVEIGVWLAQGSGLEFQSATLVDPTQPFGTEILQPSRGTQSELRYRVGYSLPKKLGTFIATAYEHEDDDLEMSMFSPGEFVYGTLWASAFAGFANDGLADGFEYSARNSIRDLRIDYMRELYRNARGGASWFVGVRRVQHARSQQATYYAILPDRPALPPEAGNRADLAPTPDFASVGSRYEARGFEAGMEFDVALIGDDFRLEGGFSLATLRGDMTTSYRSITSVYTADFPDDGQGLIVLDPADYFIIGETFVDPMSGNTIAYADFVEQVNVLDGIQDANGREVSSTALEVWLGFRVKLWRYFDLLGGFRQTQYSDVGLDLTTFGESSRSAIYEGFYGAVSARF